MMMKNHPPLILHLILGLICWTTIQMPLSGQQFTIPVDSANWEISEGKFSDVAGKIAFAGTAYLKNGGFSDGIIEFNVWVTGQRGYPGVIFRMAAPGDYERIYFRPHLPSYFQNVVQYCGTYNDIDAWQLYSGKGYTASAELVKNEWFHVKVEIRGTQARVFINNQAVPSLFIPHLAHGVRQGGMGVSCAVDGSAWFADFSWKSDDHLIFPPETQWRLPFGVIAKWQLSKVFRMNEADNERTPSDQGLSDLQWTDVTCRPDGIVDISRYHPRSGNLPDVVFAKATLIADKDTAQMFSFGYSDVISVFLNGELLFAGNSAYTSRDPNFQGIVGLNDYLVLPLKKGRNELLISLTEMFGGWGFIFTDAKAIDMHPTVSKAWELKKGLSVPESAVYDPKRDVVYVSSYYNDGKEYISKISPEGKILQEQWVTGIMQPTGLCMNQDKLYAVGRFALLEIDPETATILNRFRFPNPGAPNDVAADDRGNLYVTDTRRNLIYRCSGGRMEEWLNDQTITKPNGILFDNGRLLIGTSEDGCLKQIDPETKAIATFVCFEGGALIDGITPDGLGGYFVSDFSGRIFRIHKDKTVQLLIDGTAPQKNYADFEYIREKNLLVVPGFGEHMLTGYRITEK